MTEGDPAGRGNNSSLIMFLVLRESVALDNTLRTDIAASIRTSLSPRFVPDQMLAAPGIPRTLSGKKQELPIKRVFQGRPIEKIINREAMANPEVLDWYAQLAGASRFSIHQSPGVRSDVPAT